MKLTIDTFKTNLKDGKYKDAGGARKALGKAQGIPKKDKEALQDLINKHFGASASAPAVKVVKGKTTSKKRAESGAVAGTIMQTLTEPARNHDGGMEAVSAARALIEDSLRGISVIKANPVDGVMVVPAVEELQDNIVYGTKVLRRFVEKLEGAAKQSPKSKAPKNENAQPMNGVSEGTVAKAVLDFDESTPQPDVG